MNIKPKNSIEKNNIANPKFLNFIRGMVKFFPFAFSALSNI